MKIPMLSLLLRWMPRAVIASTVVILAGGSAQTPPTIPLIDLSIGPVAVNAQAVNVALALSVEFPTVGAAYRTDTYDHSVTYLGYWDPKGCYAYKDIAAGAPLSGDYFYRTGTVDADRHCDGTAYSGNALNYVATSSIDLLRYALTGGNRVADTESTTVLERAYLYSSWNLHNGTYFPAHKIPAAKVGLVVPTPTDPAKRGLDIYGGSCLDRLWFGTSNGSQSCTGAGTTTSGNLNPPTVNTATTQQVSVVAGSPAPAFSTFLSTTWEVTNPLQTSTVAPTSGPIDYTDVPTTAPGTSTTAPPSPLNIVRGYVYTANGTTTTNTATLYVPGGGLNAEPTVIVGTTTATLSTRRFQTAVPAAPFRTFQFTSTSINVCRSTASTTSTSFIGLLDSAGNPTDAPGGGSGCGNGAYSGFSSRGRINSPPLPLTVYEPLQSINVYARHDRTAYYNNYTLVRVYKLYRLMDQYSQPIVGTSPGPMYARVRVCDDAEKTTRTDLCQRYPNGNYKPVGEIQLKSEALRVSAFGYVAQDSNDRYGGVLRAPMRYPGPTYRDPAGVKQTNPAPEWNVNNGIFASDPLGASPTFATSGVINYLNKFGTTGTKGYYKALDPVGELYYEALRYFQGLGPTAAAVANMTDAYYDGFPVYSTTASGKTSAGWVDPVQNACERRNFILAIGDVNTHKDKQLPGLNALATVEDPARAAEPLLGDATKVFDAVAWTTLLTGFETGTSLAYTDAQGRAQTTAGNPNTNANNTNLQGKTTGSSSSAYYWAGAAYWANTQPIRYDTKAGESMRNIRVKTFTIDVDEGGNGSIEDTNPRGIKPRRSSFYLAGKYGWFKDSNDDGNPFKASGGLTNNTEWEDPQAQNTPDGYVIASQAQKLIDGIKKFFTAATSERGAVSVSAVSSQRFTTNDPNGNLFSPRFDPSDWSGTVQRSGLRLNSATDSIDATAGITWDAGDILTQASVAGGTVNDPLVKPVDRKIFTMSRGTGAQVGQEFTADNKNALDTAVLNALNTNPTTGTTDSQADARINWIRGNRSDEQNGTTGFLRLRKKIMGDVINSGPVYKQDADLGVTGPDYNTFARSVSSREAVIYVGANDGMLHAFRASDGKELFSYIPRAVAADLNKLTAPGYQHRPFVDGVPVVNEARIGTAWKTVLASGMGGGANGIFALDVTSPTTFGASNVLFEFTDQDDSDMGSVLSQPKIVKMRMAGSGTPVYKWFIAVSSGYNNYKNDGYFSLTGQQALFLLSLDKAAGSPWVEGSNYYKVKLPAPVLTTAAGLANPGYATGRNGEATIFYAGDLNGNMWKFDFNNGLSSANAAASVKTVGGVATPLSVARDAGNNRQPITVAPVVGLGLNKGNMVVFGTGKFMEPSDSDNSATQTMYGIWDSATTTDSDFGIGRSKLYQRTMTVGATTSVSGSATFAFGDGSSSTYRGWYVDLPTLRERISVEGVGVLGQTAINSTIPDGTCSGDGSSTTMCWNNLYGTMACEFKRSTAGLLGRPNVINVDDSFEAYGLQSATGKRLLTINISLISTGTRITDAGNVATSTSRMATAQIPTDRLGWREVRNFKEN